MKILILTTTFKDKEEAQKICDMLLQQKLIACGQLSEINSKFFWKEKLDSQKEFMLTMKTTSSKYKLIEKVIKQNHSYDLPEIIATKACKISKEYKNWVIQSTTLK